MRVVVAAVAVLGACDKTAGRSADPLTLASVSAPASAGPEPELLEPIGEPASRGDAAVGVELPLTPEFVESDAPDRYEDGAWSIAGIRRDLDRHVAEGEAGTRIMVRAWVDEIYVPPTCDTDNDCPPAKLPHLWITDDPDDHGRARAMLVVGYEPKVAEKDAATSKGVRWVVLEVGKRYTIDGRVRMATESGFAGPKGLLEFVAYRPLDPETGAELDEWVVPLGSRHRPRAR